MSESDQAHTELNARALPAISNEQLQNARSEALRGRRRWIDVLEEQTGLAPAVFTAALGKTLRYATLSMDQIHALHPAFDLLPFATAVPKQDHVFCRP